MGAETPNGEGTPRPKVDPTWRKCSNGGWQLHLEGAELGSLRQCAASVYTDNRWSVWQHINDCGATYGARGGDATGTDEAKAACVKALRAAGYAFVGDPDAPAAKPEPKGRIVRKWVLEGRSHVLLRENGFTAGRVASSHIEAWREGPPGTNRMWRMADRGILTLEEAKATAERWLTEAGYEIVDPPAEPTGRIELHPPGYEITGCRYSYLTSQAAEAIDAELARGSVPLGVVDWCPGPEFRLFTPAEMAARADEILREIHVRPGDSSLWARLAELSAGMLSAVRPGAKS